MNFATLARSSSTLRISRPNAKFIQFSTRVPLIAGHKFAGRPRLQLFFVAGVFGFGASYWAYRTSTTYVVEDPIWVRPVPTCYVGGRVFYREPGSGACFDFARAEPGDYFECNKRVYRWYPERVATVEDSVADDDENNESADADEWVKTNESVIKAKADRVATVTAAAPPAATAPVSPAQIDCSSCLAAEGPVDAGNGMCTLTIANNCPQPISFKGGMSRPSDNGTLACEFSDDVETGAQKTVCTASCTSFEGAEAFITAATVKAGWKGRAASCRVLDPAKVEAATKVNPQPSVATAPSQGDSDIPTTVATAPPGDVDIYAPSAMQPPVLQ